MIFKTLKICSLFLSRQCGQVQKRKWQFFHLSSVMLSIMQS